MEIKTLGDLVFETLEEYKQENNPKRKWYDKYLSNLEHNVAEHYSKWVMGISLVSGIAGAHLLGEYYETLKSAKNLAWFFSFSGFCSGALMGYAASAYLLTNSVGKRLYSKIKSSAKKSKEKRWNVFRYPKVLSIATTTALHWNRISKIPDNISAFDLGFIGMTLLGANIAFHLARDTVAIGKDAFKNLYDAGRCWLIYTRHAKKPDDRIKALERLVNKSGSNQAKYALGKNLMKRDVIEGLAYAREWIDELGRTRDELKFKTLKGYDTGVKYTQLFGKRDNLFSFFDLVYKIMLEDKKAAERIIEKAHENLQEDKVGMDCPLIYIYEKISKKPQTEKWAELAIKMRRLAKEGKEVKRFSSSEGEVYTSPSAAGYVLLKDFRFNSFRRFLKQTFEHQTLIEHNKRSERPLAFLGENGNSSILATMEGEQNLREELRDKSPSYRWKVFEETIYKITGEQRILFEKLKPYNGTYYTEIVMDDKIYPLLFDILNLDTELYHRAFVGDDKRKNRFGKNKFLQGLWRELLDFEGKSYALIELTLNHGDSFGTNRTRQGRFDAKHIITDTIYDTSYFSLDPSFLDFGRERKAETAFNAYKNVYRPSNNSNNNGFKTEFMNSFDCIYSVHNGLGLSASQNANGYPEIGASILKEVVACSAGREYRDSLMRYLENSQQANELLRMM